MTEVAATPKPYAHTRFLSTTVVVMDWLHFATTAGGGVGFLVTQKTVGLAVAALFRSDPPVVVVRKWDMNGCLIAMYLKYWYWVTTFTFVTLFNV